MVLRCVIDTVSLSPLQGLNVSKTFPAGGTSEHPWKMGEVLYVCREIKR